MWCEGSAGRQTSRETCFFLTKMVKKAKQNGQIPGIVTGK
jgi:ribosomal protein L39E